MAEPVEGHNRLDAPREMPRGDERERAEVREHDGGEGNDSRPEELRDFRFQVSEQSKAQPRAGAGPVQGSIVGDRIDSAANDTGGIVQAEIGAAETGRAGACASALCPDLNTARGNSNRMKY